MDGSPELLLPPPMECNCHVTYHPGRLLYLMLGYGCLRGLNQIQFCLSAAS